MRLTAMKNCNLIKTITSISILLSLSSNLFSESMSYTDRTSFLADMNVTNTSTINFDTISVGTDLTNQTISGVKFEAPGTSPLEVVDGETLVRSTLFPSSGANVLSPGGSSTSLENDDLRLVFNSPVKAAGLDIVFDVPDGASFVSIEFFDESNNSLFTNSFIPAPSGSPGFQFMGFASDTAIIKSILLNEFDGTASDDHVAYDTITFTTSVIPEPSTYALLLSVIVSSKIIFSRFKNR